MIDPAIGIDQPNVGILYLKSPANKQFHAGDPPRDSRRFFPVHLSVDALHDLRESAHVTHSSLQRIR